MDINEYREHHTVWIASLSNGEEVCCYDVNAEDSWTKLKSRIESQQDLKVVGLRLCFRSNCVSLPPNQPGYLFVRGILASMNKQHGMYSIGFLRDDGTVYIKQYIVPELVEWDFYVKERHQCLQTLIINPITEPQN